MLNSTERHAAIGKVGTLLLNVRRRGSKSTSYLPTHEPTRLPPNFGVVAPTLLSFSEYSEQLLIEERVHLNDEPNLIFYDNNLIFGDNNLIFCDSLRCRPVLKQALN